MKLLVADDWIVISDSMIEGSRTRKLLQREKSIEEEIHHVSW